MSRALQMSPAQRAYRARVFAEANRRTRNMRPLGSIVWGTRARGMGFTTAGGLVTDFNTLPMPGTVSPGLFRNPDTLPGVWPGLNPAPVLIPGPISQEPPPPVFPANGSPGQVPVVVTPTSGPIPSPGTVAAGTTAPASWLDQQMIGGIPNKYLLLGGLGAFIFFGGKRK